ncbi:hypothetical protein KC332_g16972 [Hortaea werneckii]|nr:hypothetical protein KC358_g17148 [Hortaea werneckii]KAI6795719.1 hypothetical protein KC350_g16972 [Hortaea werneckii]KAI6899610.1 hypothetical protein KC348_g17095 [Hortaea werneckii]KAI6919744.1 hypothetical protein KC341_g17065 [Hortaea werneckii]KAI6953264.1 hypothetical protein KC321_g17068 [Hortaea werneckii]
MKGTTLALAFLASLEPAYSLPGWGRLARNANDLKKVEAEIERAGKGRRWGSGPWGTGGSNSTYGTGLTTGTGGTGVAGPTGITTSGSYIGDGIGGSAAPQTTETVSTVQTDYTTVYPTASYGNDYTSTYETTVVVPTTYETTLTLTVYPSATGGKQPNGQPQITSAKETVPAKQTEPASGEPWTVITSTEVETKYTTVYPTASRYTSNGQPQISSWDETSTGTSTYTTTITLTIPYAETGKPENGHGGWHNGWGQWTKGNSPHTVETTRHVPTEYTTVYPTATRYTSDRQPHYTSWDATSTVTSTYTTTLTFTIPATKVPHHGGGQGGGYPTKKPLPSDSTYTTYTTTYTTTGNAYPVSTVTETLTSLVTKTIQGTATPSPTTYTTTYTVPAGPGSPITSVVTETFTPIVTTTDLTTCCSVDNDIYDDIYAVGRPWIRHDPDFADYYDRFGDTDYKPDHIYDDGYGVGWSWIPYHEYCDLGSDDRCPDQLHDIFLDV